MHPEDEGAPAIFLMKAAQRHLFSTLCLFAPSAGVLSITWIGNQYVKPEWQRVIRLERVLNHQGGQNNDRRTDRWSAFKEMKMTSFSQNMTRPVLMSLLVLGLAGCETMNQPGYGYDQAPTYRQSSNSRDGYAMYGTVQSIELVRQERTGSTIGLGTIAGAVVGGIVGNQIGSGKGNTAATVVGAAGGAYVGHELENRNQQQVDTYRVTIRMENGSHQTLIQDTSDDIRVGDRVRIENGVARRY